MKELRRLLASEPMSMAGRRKRFRYLVEAGRAEGSWCRSNVGIGRCRKLLHTVISPADDAICEGVVVPEGGREKTQGYQRRMETASVLLYRFLIIIGVEL